MSASVLSAVCVPVCSARTLQPQQRSYGAMPAKCTKRVHRRQQLRCAATENGSSTASPVVGTPQQQHVIKMVNLVHMYFDVLLTQGDSSVMSEILEPSISHKDMVRNVGRVGMKEYEAYLKELHATYPEYYVKASQFGIVDARSMFVSFEGQVSVNTPKFFGVDLFTFNGDGTKIREVQVYRSNWLGAQGHEERKKLAVASAKIAKQAEQRGQLP
ncbi:hypothetical protein D9Q98_005222 [Chlorella vulgaris]|uniref:SnoaL-like domain-containing protein n=1 Tax=Chlorella vulgaris TaxID=3077 RepID=A0A9D4TP40_CHLVU|nr:hypothetical protein D9Q98_005222 [Chlorella vulgaris]